MNDLTREQLQRQDFVDNSIFELMQSLISSGQELAWDIDMVGEIRDCIETWLVERLEIQDSQSFYPHIRE